MFEIARLICKHDFIIRQTTQRHDDCWLSTPVDNPVCKRFQNLVGIHCQRHNKDIKPEDVGRRSAEAMRYRSARNAQLFHPEVRWMSRWARAFCRVVNRDDYLGEEK